MHSSFVLSASDSASFEILWRSWENCQSGWICPSNSLKRTPSPQMPFNISSITLFDRFVTVYSMLSISLRSADSPSSSVENCRAEARDTSSAGFTSLVWYSGRPMKRSTNLSVSRIGTLSKRRTRGSESRDSIGLDISRVDREWRRLKAVVFAHRMWVGGLRLQEVFGFLWFWWKTLALAYVRNHIHYHRLRNRSPVRKLQTPESSPLRRAPHYF